MISLLPQTANKYKFVLSSLFILALVAFSSTLSAQKGKLKFDVVVDCVEPDGEGNLVAYFGYQNGEGQSITVDEASSVITLNNGQSKKYGLTTFEPGYHPKAFSETFSVNERVLWEVDMGNGKTKVADANINSNHCSDFLNIIPYFEPPEGGKLTGVKYKYTAALYSLLNLYLSDPVGFQAVQIFLFQYRIPGVSGYPEVMVKVQSEPGQYATMISELNTLGFDQLTHNPGREIATGYFPMPNIMLVNDIVPLKFMWEVSPGVSNSYVDPNLGTVTSEGDRAMRGDFARLGFGVDGTGVKIGVISNSYNTKNQAAGNVTSGDLPGVGNPNGYTTPVDVVKDVPVQYGVLSDEGRAMLQIIHDVAPGAELAFRTGYLGVNDMALGIQQLVDAGCDIIVEDLSYLDEPFFADGVISQAIDNAVAQGVTFFSSAGNFGPWSISQQFMQGPNITSIPGKEHDWSGGSGDNLAAVSLEPGVVYTAVLQWDDGTDPTMMTTQTDMDFYFSNGDASALLGFNYDNTGLQPIEIIPFYVEQETVLANMVVSIASGPNVPVTFKLLLFRGGDKFHFLEYGGQGTSTIVGHPNAAGTITVGAVRYDMNPTYSPDTYTVPQIMSFSSTGGTPVNGVVRNKPDITAPNGVNTTVELYEGADWSDDEDLLPNFFGTSAASPHAAAVAALIKQAWAKFEPGTPLTPGDIRTILKTTAIDMDAPGDDFISGSGFIQAHKAIMSFANPTPYLTNVIPEEGVVPGESLTPFSFDIEGGYFTGSTEVIVDGVPLSSGVVIQDENSISVDEISFLGYAGVQAQTQSISSSGLDGGTTDPVYFTDPIVRTVLISADDKSKTYGEVMPEFTGTLSLITEDDETLTLEQAIAQSLMFQSEADRLSMLSFTTSADPLSGADFYSIVPAISDFDVDNPVSLLEQAIVEKYNIVYENGVLEVDPLAVNITPQNVEMVYGQSLAASDISFIYTIADNSVVLDDPDAVLSAVQASHMSALSNDIAIVHGVTIINGIPMVNGQTLQNGIPMVNGRAMVNGIEVLVETDESGTTNVYIGGELVPEDGPVPNGIPMVNGRPMVNLDQIVNGRVMVNGEELTIESGFITALNGIPLVNNVPVENGIPMVNGRAMVNGHEVIVESGTTTVDGVAVPSSGVVEVNGIPMVNGIPLVNFNTVTNGRVMVNSLEITIENGIPMVNDVSIVNGIPMVNGRVMVNSLDVNVSGGEITQVKLDGEVQTLSGDVNVLNGIPMVNGRVLVNGRPMVNGMVPVDSDGNGSDAVDLENVSLMASQAALENGRAMVNGRPMVNGLEGIDPGAFSIATGTTNSDGTVSYESSPIINDMALVNGRALVNGTAMVNGRPMVNGIPMVNAATTSDEDNFNALILFDASQFGGDEEATELTGPVQPTSFITGTTVGVHAIVPGSIADLSVVANYYPAQLTILPTEISVSADDQSKVYGDPDPELTYQAPALLGTDQWEGTLNREAGENAGTYAINQGTLNAGTNYSINFTDGTLTIDPATLTVTALAADKYYDGTVDADVTLSDDRLVGDELTVAYTDAQFEDANAAENKTVTVSGITLEGTDAGNYTASGTVQTTASIYPKDVTVSLEQSFYFINEMDPLPDFQPVYDGLIAGDMVTVSYAVLRDTDGMPYDQASDESAGRYSVTPNAFVNSNYSFLAEPSILHVNPYGPGTKAVKPSLNCIEELSPGYYVAHFAYSNDNDFDVYVPHGPDNLLEGIGIDWSISEQSPELFLTTGGTFDVYFTESVTWTVASREDAKTVRQASGANSSSTKCPTNTKSASVSTGIDEPTGPEVLNAYPNPVADVVYLSLQGIENYQMIHLYDLSGKSYPVTPSVSRSDLLEIDLASLPSGPYFIRVVMEDSAMVVPIVKK